MEKITLVETFKLSEEEIHTLGNAVNILADVVDFVHAESDAGVRVQLPEQLQNILGILSVNLEDLTTNSKE